MATATAYAADHMRTLGHSVSSSAMRSWAIVMTDEGADLLILFREGGTVYRYAFRAWEDARAWDVLRQQSEEEDAEPVSWGKALHRFQREGALIAA
jgi:hypothetical protein